MKFKIDSNTIYNGFRKFPIRTVDDLSEIPIQSFSEKVKKKLEHKKWEVKDVTYRNFIHISPKSNFDKIFEFSKLIKSQDWIDHYIEEFILKAFHLNRELLNYRTNVVIDKEFMVMSITANTMGTLVFDIAFILNESNEIKSDGFPSVELEIKDEHLKDCEFTRNYFLNRV